MDGSSGPRFRAGSTIDDLCRACKLVRKHTVFAVDGKGTPIRVVCDFCGSQHNFRGGERVHARRPPTAPRSTGDAPGASPRSPFPAVSDRERSVPTMPDDTAPPSTADLELLLRRILREESGLTPVAPAEKWRGGDLVLRPGKEGLQEKTMPIETFFNKIVMVRNRLRVLEQQVNGSELPADAKLKIQGYITACYGSLTSFNILFATDDDRFRGGGGGGGGVGR